MMLPLRIKGRVFPLTLLCTTPMLHRRGRVARRPLTYSLCRGQIMSSATVFLLLVFVTRVPGISAAASEKIPIGAIFEQGTDEVQSAFKYAIAIHNQNVTRRFDLQAFVDVINTADAFKLSRLICNQFSRGVFSMLGAVSPDSFDTLHSYSNTFQMPFVTPWFPEKVLTPSSGFLDFAISMRPDYHRAIIDTVRHYGWKKIIYLYDSHDGNLLIVDCGLHEGWPTVSLPKFAAGDDPISLTTNQEVLVINLMYVGVGIGAIAPIFTMDRIGRKWTLLVAAVPKIFSWIAIGLANSHVTLCAARMLAGVGCGVSYSVMPMYIGEISTKRTRGPLGTLQSVLINIGILLIYTIGLYVNRFTMAMMSLGVPLLFIITFIWLPETSVYLTRKNRLINAEKTLKWSLGKENVTEELEEIKRIVAIEDDVKQVGLFHAMKEAVESPVKRRAAAIMFLLANTLSFTGAAPIFSYQSFIFQDAGYDIGADIGIIITGCSIVLAGIVCVSLVKIAGKRRLLLISAPIAALSLGIVATFFTLKHQGVDVAAVNWIPTVFVIIYVIAYGLALNPMPLAYLGELFSFDMKVTAGICTSLYYAISTTAAVKIYQVLTDSYGTHTAFWFFTVITAIVTILIYFYIFETEGMSLAEIQTTLHELSKGSSIKSTTELKSPSKKSTSTPTISLSIN